jgi:hypothetical protein
MIIKLVIKQLPKTMAKTRKINLELSGLLIYI